MARKTKPRPTCQHCPAPCKSNGNHGWYKTCGEPACAMFNKRAAMTRFMARHGGMYPKGEVREAVEQWTAAGQQGNY